MAKELEIAGKPRPYGPRELSGGTLTCPPLTATELIPLATKEVRPVTVLYFPDPNDADTSQRVSWEIGSHIMIYGEGRIHVKEGIICFNMLQYDDRRREGKTG